MTAFKIPSEKYEDKVYTFASLQAFEEALNCYNYGSKKDLIKWAEDVAKLDLVEATNDPYYPNGEKYKAEWKMMVIEAIANLGGYPNV